MTKNSAEQTKSLGLQKTVSTDSSSVVTDVALPANDMSDSKSISESLTKAQNQLGLCLQRQRQVGFILREVKDILKR
jgi:hypothetical protein